MSEEKTITVNEREFKSGRISPVDMLTMSSMCMSVYETDDNGQMTMNFSSKKSINAIESFYEMIFEHMLVKVGEKWLPVKEKDKDIWWPENLQEDYFGMMKLVNWFVAEVIFPVFMRSRE